MLGLWGPNFRSWALLGYILRTLLRLLSLLVVFRASWGAPGSILDGSGRVRRGFSRSQGLIFQCFFAHACLQCETTSDVQKPQFFLGFSRFFTYRTQCAHIKKRCEIVSEAFHAALPQKNMLKTCLEVRPPRFWRGLGHYLAGFWALLGISWPFLGPSWTPLGRFLGALGRLLAGLGLFRGAFYLPWMARTSILEGLGVRWAGFWRALGACFGIPCAAPRAT